MDAINLDHNATTPTRPEVAEAIVRALKAGYANPASQHCLGQAARKVLEDARERIAALLGADLTSPQPDRLIFTGTATEANNLAVLGIAGARSKVIQPTLTPSPSPTRLHGGTRREDGGRGETAPGHIIISAIEHQSVIEPAEHLLELGWRLDTLGVTPAGVVRIEMLAELLRPKTAVVSVMLGNHDTGVLQPVAELAALCNAAGVPMHTDAVQVAGKLPVDFRTLGVTALTVAAHKFGGPVGIGALLLRHDTPIEPLLFGGYQQHGLRPGTESLPLVLGMQTALELWHRDREQHATALGWLRERFESGLTGAIPGTIVHGEGAARLPQTTNAAFPDVDGQVLLIALSMSGIACSVGSACSSGATELSPTLRAMGLPTDIVSRSLRFSLGATTTEAEIDEAVRRIAHVWSEVKA